MTTTLTLCHGSKRVIETPVFGKGNSHNDYGLGFYCTVELELAKEWACSDKTGGFATVYELDTTELTVMDLSDPHYGLLDWLAVLVNNRTFSVSNPIASEAKEYVIKNFLPDISCFDAITGYRADDSYFTFALDFLNNTISLRQLGRAMALGTLGKQFVLKSQKAFETIRFVRSESADGEIYFVKRHKRDRDAREQYLKRERRAASVSDDIFMIDILRGEMKQSDERIQRTLSEKRR
jgi:hypothetical protein